MYVIARNKSNRPTLQHITQKKATWWTLCGRNMQGWSRAYQKHEIPQLICRNCLKVSSS